MSLVELIPPLMKGLWVTTGVTLGGAVVATIAAFTAGLARLSRHWWVRAPALVYIDVFRGTSALVQLFWAYFALPLFGVELDAITVGILVLGLNVGAYGAEVVRAAILGVPRDQYEAALSLNFNERQITWRIIVPQALPAMLPPFGNLLIELLKATALVSLITLGDLTFQAQVLRGATLQSAEIFSLVLAMYFALAVALTWGVRHLERRLAIGQDRGGVR
jgi:polar amino acid transport system permease protein